MLDELDKRIIAIMQDDFPIIAEPYREIAEKIGIDEAELLRRLNSYRQSGQMRKLGAVLRHREVGYAANALCAWVVSDERLDEVGKKISRHPAVTHCYARISQPGWPYNFYTMVHAHTRGECKALAKELALEAGLEKYIMLFSTREWKKTSMHYFREEESNV